MADVVGTRAPRLLGRYVLYEEVAAGGMATVHLARMVGAAGFSRTVAIKRLHAHLAREPEFVVMFLDEARLAARIQHPNVVHTLDVVALDGELFLVMEFVQGESLAGLRRALDARGERIPPRMASAIVGGALHGLHAAHTAVGERGEPLSIVHRDVSPQNILVGIDGVPRLLDFGIAKAIGRLQTTRDGQIKGKTSYMAPEQLKGKDVDARTDIYAASVVAWEALTAQRLFTGGTPEEIMMAILEKRAPPPSSIVPDVPSALDAVVLKGLARNPELRFATARDMAVALEEAVAPATARELGDWVQGLVGEAIERRGSRMREIESESDLCAAAASASGPDATAITTPDVAVRTETAPDLGRSRRRRAWLLATASAALLVSGGLVAVRPRGTARDAPASSQAVSVPAAVTSSGGDAVPVVVSAPPAERAAPSAARPANHASPLRSAKPKASCNPPYTVSADGFRNPKSECF